MTMTIAASLAASSIVREMSTKYVALYFIDNEPRDLGLPAPKEPAVPAKLEPAVPSGGPSEAPLQTIAGGPTIGAVTPILIASASNDVAVPTALATPAVLSVAETVPAASDDTAAERADDVVEAAPASAPGDEAAVEPEVDSATAAMGGGVVVDPVNQIILELARDTPHRRPDGTAFLPIATQRVFDMRWQVSRIADVPMAHEIPGHVITNPGTGTMVHAALAGVIEANQGTFPYIGMTVRAGDLLAYLQPTMNVSERTQIEARVQQLVNLISLTEKQIERLKEVMFVRYRVNKIESMKVQMDGYRRELATLQSSLGSREALRATADGVISRIDAVVGGTVDQGQAVFEIVDPDALWIEAAAYDPEIASNIRNATAVTSDGQGVDLEFIGGGLVLSNQAIPLRFRVLNAPEGLSVGKPVTVIVRHEETIAGIPVPAASVIRDGDGRSVVWERMTAETFLPRQVRAVRVAGDIMVVQSGLADGARVVTEGATLLNQVR
jgi:cobalt-zinc-cadmium efflux system membrane fusion protein